MQPATNADSIAQFYAYIAGQKPLLTQRYEKLLAKDLSQQQWDGCFGRNVLAVLGQTYDEALAFVQTLAFDSHAAPVNRGMSALTQALLAAFEGFVDEFLLMVVDKHRTSCALSNFPDEHKPDTVYINAVKRDIAGLWQHFAINTNAYLLDGL